MNELPNQVDQYTLVIGLFLPMLIALVNQQAWNSAIKSGVAIAACVVAAALELVIKGQFSTLDLGKNALAIAFLVGTSYQMFWKPSHVTDKIESSTSVGGKK